MKLCLGCGATHEAPDWTCPACGQAPARRDGYPAFAPELCDGDGSDAHYRHDDLVAAEPWHFWFRNRRRLILWALREHFPLAHRFLEVGCGTGFVLEGIREASPDMALAGSDSLASSLRYAGARLPGAALFQMDARRIPFREEFDVIGAFDVLEHLDEDEAVLAEMRRALRPGGGVLLTVPQHDFLWSAVDDFSRHRRRYARGDLVSKLGRSGFRVLRTTSFTALVLPLLLLSRLGRRRLAGDFDPAAELRVGKLVNVAMGVVLGAEFRLVTRGVSFPAGGSLLAIAARA